MRIRNINDNDIENLLQLGEWKKSFKDTLLSWMEDSITKLEWCFIAEDNNKFLGRVVYGVFDNNLEILDIGVKEANYKILFELLKYSLEEMKTKGFRKVEYHIYSDKDGFEEYVEILKRVGFNITQEKKSFTWESDRGVSNKSGRLTFKNLEEIGMDSFIEAIEKVTYETLDRDDIECVKEFGNKQAAANYFNQLKDIDFNKEWWRLAYTYNNKLIGLIIPQKLNEDVGAINYIGVIPKERGKGYVRDLIIEGVTVLKENNIKKVIADIDTENHPMDSALSNEGFKMDCKMLVLKLNY